MKNLEGKIPVEIFQKVTVFGLNGKKKVLNVKIDTGALSTSIDQSIANELGLLEKDNILREKSIRSALGLQVRKIVGIEFSLAGQLIKTRASISDRSNLRYQMIIGRRDLETFVIWYSPETEPDDTR